MQSYQETVPRSWHGMSGLKPSSLLFAAVLSLTIFWSSPTLRADDESRIQAINELLANYNDHLELVRKYWPRVGKGDLLAMTVTYTALNNCANFKEEISAADNVDDLEASLQGKRAHSDILFAKGVFYQCKSLVEHYAEFPGWPDLQLRAALAGDIISKIYIALQYYSLNNKRPREDFPFSPAQFLIDAMVAGNYLVFGQIAENAHARTILKNKSQTTITAWSLLSCKYYDYCDRPESLNNICRFMLPECLVAKNLRDLYRKRVGEGVFAAANILADELYLAVQQKRFEDLGLNLVW